MNYPDAFDLLRLLDLRPDEDLGQAVRLFGYVQHQPAPATPLQMALWAAPSGLPHDELVAFFSRMRPFCWPPGWFEACVAKRPGHIRARVLRERYGDNTCTPDEEKAWMQALGYVQVLRGGVTRYVL